MVQFDRGPTKGDRSLDTRWHDNRRFYRETINDPDNAGSIDKAKYDLDDAAAEVTGEHVDRTFTYEKPMRQVNRPGRQSARRDLRENPRIGTPPR